MGMATFQVSRWKYLMPADSSFSKRIFDENNELLISPLLFRFEILLALLIFGPFLLYVGFN